jgi:hypothetical protein
VGIKASPGVILLGICMEAYGLVPVSFVLIPNGGRSSTTRNEQIGKQTKGRDWLNKAALPDDYTPILSFSATLSSDAYGAHATRRWE